MNDARIKADSELVSMLQTIFTKKLAVLLTNPSVEAMNLSKRYGSFNALSNLSLKLEGAKCVGFLGPNGAGKTTTLKLFTDLIRVWVWG